MRGQPHHPWHQLRRRQLDRNDRGYIDAGGSLRSIALRRVVAVIGPQRDDFGRGLPAELDALRLGIAIGDCGKRGGERGVEVGLLIRKQRNKNVMGRRACRRFARRAAVGNQIELVGRVSLVDGVDRLEDCDMQHGLATRIGRVHELLLDADGVGFRVPVHDNVGFCWNREQCEADDRDDNRWSHGDLPDGSAGKPRSCQTHGLRVVKTQ